MNDSSMHVLVVDALVGNDYSLCLCNGLDQLALDIELVTVEEREAPFPVSFPLRTWAPSKKAGGSRGAKLKGYVVYLLRLFRYLKTQGEKADTVAHFQFFRRERVEAFFLVLLRLSGIKLVYTVHNILPHESSKIDRFLKYMVYRAAHGLIVHSEYVKKALLEAFSLDPAKVHVVSHGNFDHYLPEKVPSMESARSELGLKESDRVLLFFGYIRAYKGLDMLLEAFEIVAHENPHAKLVIAGAPHTEALRRSTNEAIERSAARDSITFHGRFIPHESISDYFAASDLVVLPYKHIYHSGIIHLAYSYGKAVVATNVGDFNETIEQGKSGYVVDKNTPEVLAEWLLKALDSPEHLVEMGRYARALSETKYSWEDIGRKTAAVYRSIF